MRGYAHQPGYHGSNPQLVPGSGMVVPGSAGVSTGLSSGATHGAAAGYSGAAGAISGVASGNGFGYAGVPSSGAQSGYGALTGGGVVAGHRRTGSGGGGGAYVQAPAPASPSTCPRGHLLTQVISGGAAQWGNVHPAAASQAPRHSSLDSQASSRAFSADVPAPGAAYGGHANSMFPFHAVPPAGQPPVMGLSSPAYQVPVGGGAGGPQGAPFFREYSGAGLTPMGGAASAGIGFDGLPEGGPAHPAAKQQVAQGEPVGASPYPGAPASRSLEPPAKPHSLSERPAWREALCERAFSFVDSEGTGQLNMHQNKTGLTMVLSWLGDVPMPKDSWYVKVFRNFVDNDQGLIDFESFREVVTQWDEHHLKKKAKAQEAEQRGGRSEATPDTSIGDSSMSEVSHNDFHEYSKALAKNLSQGHDVIRQEILAFMEKSARALLSEKVVASSFAPFDLRTPRCQHGEVERVVLEITIKNKSGIYQVSYKSSSCVVQEAPVPPPPPSRLPSSQIQMPVQGSTTSSGAKDAAEERRPPVLEETTAGTTRVGSSTEEEDADDDVATSNRCGGPPSSAQKPGFAAGHLRTRSEPAPATACASDASAAQHALSPGGKASGRATAAAEINPDVMFPTYVGRLAIFDDYEFFGDVGHGAFGKVMVVRHRATKQLRACKVVMIREAMQRDLIDTEIKLLKSLNHPNIMKMHEVYFEQVPQQKVTNGNIYIITELCEGGDLGSRIEHHYTKLKQPMTESHVAYMMQQILSATNYCHGQGIIHRDIKPDNILFVDRSSSSPLKIIDFGLANFTEKIRETAKEVKVPKTGYMGKIARMLPTIGGKHIIACNEKKRVMQRAGTPHYMAPEMIEGYYDQKADVFSIGIILCQLLTGWHPFFVAQVDDENSVRAKISAPEPVQFEPNTWAHVSREAQDLTKQLLEKRPENRITAAKALSHAWFRDPAKPSAFGNTEALTVSIFDGLMKYQAYNKLKRAMLQLLTKELSEFQIQELRKKFMALDTQGDGRLSPEELVEGMRHVGYDMSNSELQQVVSALDASGAQRIGYKEFISALIERRVTFDRQQLWECFKKFDVHDTGKIAYEDVKSVVAPAITESEWQEIGSHIPGGPKSRYEFTFDEFVALMKSTD